MDMIPRTERFGFYYRLGSIADALERLAPQK